MSHVPLDSTHADFAVLASIVTTIIRQGGGFDTFAEKVPALFRQAYDEVIDAPRTNRFTLEETEKTEKTYIGTKVEILVRDYLKLPKGKLLDLLVNGVEVDIKNTTGRSWMIPTESIGHPALLLRTNEKTARCDVGIVVCRPEYLSTSTNKDSKRQIRAEHYPSIWWILRDHPYPPNFWEVLPPTDREAIMSPASGTVRLARLFETVQKRPISRNQVQAIAQQHDYMKRIRRNGGARDILAPKGIAILWGSKDRDLIEQLNLGAVTPDEFVSVTPATDHEAAILRAAGHID
ncbi:NaeI family type II restriction endonuclease [Agrobacterium tumefaciens]|uniref:NaeI family type II restriction endonuclease n=1 Tax=Agrobacterium tumefaciens TaxID=358 RepID=UPI0015732B2F|nr:NaeI family type II restriction endonuclease [Agrobacterium tumefaciens]NSZ85215.1 hypothetical protein [Agrobacterium tumefaciens]WCA70466.1 NaeI family type II restriction endonuclease [Agrobacterium tumefaciens]